MISHDLSFFDILGGKRCFRKQKAQVSWQIVYFILNPFPSFLFLLDIPILEGSSNLVFDVAIFMGRGDNAWNNLICVLFKIC